MRSSICPRGLGEWFLHLKYSAFMALQHLVHHLQAGERPRQGATLVLGSVCTTTAPCPPSAGSREASLSLLSADVLLVRHTGFWWSVSRQGRGKLPDLCWAACAPPGGTVGTGSSFAQLWFPAYCLQAGMRLILADSQSMDASSCADNGTM